MTRVAGLESIEEVEAVDFAELNAIRTDEQQIAYDNKPEAEIEELVDDIKTFDGTTNKGGSSDVKISAGETSGFITYKAVGTAKYSKSGYLSIKGSTISFTTASDNAQITITYTSVSAGRTFTLNGSTYTPYEFENKTQTIVLGAAGTYEIVFDTTEHKIGTMVLEDKKPENVSYNVDSVEASLEGTEYAGTAEVEAALQITLVLEGGQTKTVTAQTEGITVRYLDESSQPVEEIVSGTYTVEIIYQDSTHTGSVSTVIENIVITIAA